MSRLRNACVHTNQEQLAQPAAIPLTAALPTPTSCIARLSARLTALDESCAVHQQRIADARATAERFSDDSADRAALAVLDERAAWFGDLESFVDDLALFLDAKMPQLEALEVGTVKLLSNRAASRQHNRAIVLEDALALVHGVSRASLWLEPREGGERRPSNADGGWQAPARRARMSVFSGAPDTSMQWLTPPEVAQFEEHAAELQGRSERLFADTKLPEFRDPTAVDEDGAPLRQSLVSRFSEWRARFTEDYNRAWGGLALASAWEFWARAEQALWDPFWPGGAVALQSPPDGMDAFAWLTHVMEFVDAGGHPSHGGDDEVVATLVSNVVVSRLITLAESRAYDPWSCAETAAAVSLADHAAQVIEGDRLKTLARAFLGAFREHVDVLKEFFSAQVTQAPPPIHPDTPRAIMYVAEQLAALASNLFAWRTLWSVSYASWSDAERSEYATVANELLTLVCDVLERAQEFGSNAAKHELAASVPTLVSAELKARLGRLY